MDFWARATALTQFTSPVQTSPQDCLRWCRANITFLLAREMDELINQTDIFFFWCTNRENEAASGEALCFLSEGLSWTCSARFLLIILITSLSFHHFLYYGCAWKMTPIITAAQPLCIIRPSPTGNLTFLAMLHASTLLPELPVSHLICDKYKLLTTLLA